MDISFLLSDVPSSDNALFTELIVLDQVESRRLPSTHPEAIASIQQLHVPRQATNINHQPDPIQPERPVTANPRRPGRTSDRRRERDRLRQRERRRLHEALITENARLRAEMTQLRLAIASLQARALAPAPIQYDFDDHMDAEPFEAPRDDDHSQPTPPAPILPLLEADLQPTEDPIQAHENVVVDVTITPSPPAIDDEVPQPSHAEDHLSDYTVMDQEVEVQRTAPFIPIDIQDFIERYGEHGPSGELQWGPELMTLEPEHSIALPAHYIRQRDAVTHFDVDSVLRLYRLETLGNLDMAWRLAPLSSTKPRYLTYRTRLSVNTDMGRESLVQFIVF